MASEFTIIPEIITLTNDNYTNGSVSVKFTVSDGSTSNNKTVVISNLQTETTMTFSNKSDVIANAKPIDIVNFFS